MNQSSSIVAEIANTIGEDGAMLLLQARGGTQVYFPPKPSADHWITKLLGQEKADAVCELMTCGIGGARVDLPLGGTGCAAQARARVDAMLREGRSERDIALASGYTIRGVRRRRAKMGAFEDPRQQSLF